MMNGFWQRLYDPRLIIAVGMVVVLICAYRILSPLLFWSICAGLLLLSILAGLVWWYFKEKNSKQGAELADLLQQDNRLINSQPKSDDAEKIQFLKQQMNESIRTLRKSRLGDKRGHAALYELPWYMMIGNPAAGKSSAIQNSGLRFPFAENNKDKAAIQGIGGTRNCDWFFSTEGILLDTAGRYAVYEEDHQEWLGFLGLLKKNRKKAPINGIIIGVSIAELMSNNPEHALKLAKNLRSRVQDLTEQLEVFAPVYVIFTKMDLVAGFTEFFSVYDDEERQQVWGATIPYEEKASKDSSTLFEEQFNILYEGLQDLSTTHLTRRHSQTISPSVMTFPLEFKSIKPALKLFISALFEENPFQFQPVFRGFYFTSALQEGVVDSPMTKQIVTQFSLTEPGHAGEQEVEIASQHGYFLKQLFSRVILADRHLVRQYLNRNRRQKRHAAFLAGLLVIGIALSVWTWSYRNNQLLIQSVSADLQKVKHIQAEGQASLSSQFDALLILQDRLEQLDRYQQDRPLSLQFGMYQGKALREKLLAEYLAGVKRVMLVPVQHNIARYLGEVNANAEALKTAASQPVEASTISASKQYTEASPTSAEDAYNALKAYLMLADHGHLESSHLNDQITRFWRAWLEANRGEMSRSDMIRKAERLISYSLAQSQSPAFPLLEADLALVDQTREQLRQVIKGMPARDRVYAEIKMRAAVRYPSITVAQVVGEQNRHFMVGSYALSGTFTKAAWNGYVNQAIDEASKSNIQGKDWVLNSVRHDDLTLTGSPEQIRRELVGLYKKDYIQEWKKFIRAIDYVPASDFNQQLKVINSLGDIEQSPARKMITLIATETSWDNPAAIDETTSLAKQGFVAWFKNKVLRQGSMPVQINIDPSGLNKAQAKLGVIGSEFEAVYNMARVREDNQKRALLDNYIEQLAAIRSRLNKIANAGDIGPSVIGLVRQTVQESGSEFNATQQLVDEQMLAGTSDEMRQLLRPLLVKPLVQSYKVLMIPAQQELNRLWSAQVYQPFSSTLASKYPFAPGARIEATANEIGRILGESGSISQFVTSQLDPLVIRRGLQLAPKTWNGIGITLNPKFVVDFPQYIAPVGGGPSTANLSNTGKANTNPDQTTFQIYPLAIAGLSEYVIDIDGQRLRYNNGLPEWVSFVWPNPSSQPGVKITATDLSGNVVTIVDEPGAYGLEKLMTSASRKKLPDGSFELRWNGQANTAPLTVKFRLISGAAASNNDAPTGSNGLKGLQLVPEVTVVTNSSGASTTGSITDASSSVTNVSQPIVQPASSAARTLNSTVPNTITAAIPASTGVNP